MFLFSIFKGKKEHLQTLLLLADALLYHTLLIRTLLLAA